MPVFRFSRDDRGGVALGAKRHRKGEAGSGAGLRRPVFPDGMVLGDVRHAGRPENGRRDVPARRSTRGQRLFRPGRFANPQP
ncbi:hypothetical protein DCO57_12540 [Labrenzia sp. 011]|nr:hypothetical protein DCO57_12540 [Labrenzia sp. 011]